METVENRPIGLPVQGPPTARWPERRTHEGVFVTLVPLDATHADDLFEAVGGERNAWLWHYLPMGPFVEAQGFRDHIAENAKSTEAVLFAVLDNRTGKPAGIVMLQRIDISNRDVEVAYVLFSPLLQQTPGATESNYLLARHVFDDLGYRRYEWKCHALNAASRRAAQRLGFKFEGVFRQHMIVRGRNRDTAWFSMLDTEWPTCRRAFEQWLAPDNFDSEGRQKSSLESFRQSERTQNC